MDRHLVYVTMVVIVALIAGIGTLIYLYPPRSQVTPSTSSNSTQVVNSTSTQAVNSTSSASTSTQSPIELLSSLSGAFTVNSAELESLVSYRPSGISINKSADIITFTNKTVYLIILAGPPNNILTFQLFNLTNPTIEVPLDSTVIIAVIDDGYLNHSFGITSTPPPYPASVSPNQDQPAFPGSEMPPTLLINGLSPASSNTYSGYLLKFNATKPGTYWYLCFVPGHASSGMYGKFVVYG
ncbi:sulfocyanin-like copper-binding protein [Thermocladium modestius]|nr:sulfocyanin-like copper-binding protein [Thermocladium modestius]